MAFDFKDELRRAEKHWTEIARAIEKGADCQIRAVSVIDPDGTRRMIVINNPESET